MNQQEYAVGVKQKAISRVFVIGLDGGDADLIDRWCAEGHLPTLQGLRRDGIWRRLRTSAEVLHFSAWPSIYTGTYPGTHGVYHAIQIRSGEQGVHVLRPDECARLPFWKFLDDAGRRCLIADAFIGYPLEDFDGIQVIDYGTWRWFSTPGTIPDGVWKELVRQFGRYPAPESMQIVRPPDTQWYRDKLIAAANLKGKIALWLMREKPWDMFFFTFGELHPAGHHLWHVDDPQYPKGLAPGTSAATHALLDVYSAVDAALGEVLRALDDSVNVIVTSGDGMGPNYAAYHLMPDVLNQLGVLQFHSTGGKKSVPGSSHLSKRALSILRNAIPWEVRRSLARCLPRSLRNKLYVQFADSDIDWSRTRAFCIPNDNEGFIRLNMLGREPQGIVEAGTAEQELTDELRVGLQELVNPHNGHDAVRRIVRTREVFSGENLQNLPDIVALWDPQAQVIENLYSDRCGDVRNSPAYELPPFYTGNHRPNAFVLARGPRISEGNDRSSGHIVDIAPTILAMLGVDPPDHMQGCVWRSFVR